MALRTNTVAFLVALTIAALLGLLILQVSLLNMAMELKDQAFRRSVSAALGVTAQKLEAAEAARGVFAAAARVPAGRRLQQTVNVTAGALPDSLGTPLPPLAMPVVVQGNRVLYRVSTPQRVTLRLFDPADGRDTVIVDTVKAAGAYEAQVNMNRFGAGGMYYRYTTDSSSFVVQVTAGTQGQTETRVASGGRKEALVDRVIDRLMIAEQVAIERRVSPAALDSVLGTSFREAGITLPYAFGVSAGPGDSLRVAQPAQYRPELQRSDLRARLFPADLFSPRHDLVVFFPDQTVYLLRQMWPVLAASIAFMLLICGAFVVTLRTVLMQKRMAQRMTDFINNMTHEFKTPISTVALAAEALLRPDVAAQPEKLQRYNRIILDENSRMRQQVDKILQMAVLEQGDYELHMTAVDAHAIIAQAAENLAVHVDARGGTVRCTLAAAAHRITADPVHFSNIIHNLLDNAAKYSPEAPDIIVSTRQEGDRLLIVVEDHGIGIGPEHLRRVFEKYYRVPTGNRHDVKGFGLGLSYVQLMVTAMGGTVRITSTEGSGTRVDLSFPLLEENGPAGEEEGT